MPAIFGSILFSDVENMKTLASVLGGDPSLMDGVAVGNAPDSE